MKDPKDYDGSGVCPRCGSGWPVCAGSEYTHADTCDRYRWADDLCGRCTLELAQEVNA
jgi:hypothetical protein